MEMETMELAEFMEEFGESLSEYIVDNMKPVYNPEVHNKPLPTLLRYPIGSQNYAIQGVALSLERNRGTVVIGEMGVGKTIVAIVAATIAKVKRPLILCPPHLQTNWRKEILETVPNAQVIIAKSVTDLEKSRKMTATADNPVWTIISRERAGNSYSWEPVYYNWSPSDDWTGKKKTPWIRCVECRTTYKDKDGVVTEYPHDLKRKRMWCQECGGAMWTATKVKNHNKPRIAFADYIKKKMKGTFDLFIADEVHEYKGKGTSRGLSAGIISEMCDKTLALTGTFMGGYSSTMFHLLHRMTRDVRTDFGHGEESKWIKKFGFQEQVIIEKENENYGGYGRASKMRTVKNAPTERPGIAPACLQYILGSTVFLRLEDVSNNLPSYEEMVVTVPMNDTPAADAIKQPSLYLAYKDFEKDFKSAISHELAQQSKKHLASYLQALLGYPDNPPRGEVIFEDPEKPELGVLVSAPALSPNQVFNKEQQLVDIVLQEKAQGRKVLVYCTHTDTRDITHRLVSALDKQFIKSTVMKAGNPSSEKRREWIDEQVKKGLDVLICNAKLVETGLNLTDFPTIVWYQTNYSVYTTRQASRRSWRIGQKLPVKVYYFVYGNTMQTKALALVARKVQCSLNVEGELPTDGLTAYASDDEDFFMTLAKEFVNDTGTAADAASIENLFREARANVNGYDDDFIVEGAWREVDEVALPELPEPVLVAANGNGHSKNAIIIEPRELKEDEVEEFKVMSLLSQTSKKKPKGEIKSLFDFALNN